MKIISLISQKGGVGKTTLATALAVAAHQNGERPVLIDLDPQASASFWKDTRRDDSIAVTAVPAARIQHVLKAAEDAGAQIAIIDTPPFAKDIAYEAAQHADFVLIPTRPAVLDVMAMTRTVELIKAFQKPAAVVLTFCPPAGREVDDTETAIKALNVMLCPVRIGQRIAYSRAQQTGLSAQEIEPGGKAAGEIGDLYVYTHKHLYRAKGTHAGKAKKRHAGSA
jgi:chromosome partitioning protein